MVTTLLLFAAAAQPQLQHTKFNVYDAQITFLERCGKRYQAIVRFRGKTHKVYYTGYDKGKLILRTTPAGAAAVYWMTENCEKRAACKIVTVEHPCKRGKRR